MELLYYATCSGRKDKYCFERKKTVRHDILEAAVEKELLKHLEELPRINVEAKNKEKSEIKSLENKLLNLNLREEEIAKIAKNYIENKLFNLLNSLDSELGEITIEKTELQEKIEKLEKAYVKNEAIEKEVSNYAQRFIDSDLETKKKIAHMFIEKIISTDDELKIFYKF